MCFIICINRPEKVWDFLSSCCGGRGLLVFLILAISGMSNLISGFLEVSLDDTDMWEFSHHLSEGGLSTESSTKRNYSQELNRCYTP